MSVVSLEIGGNDKQDKREGYNKIEVNTNNYTVNGITVTNNGDGSLTLNGTNTNKVTYIQINATGATIKNNYFNLVNGKKYYLYAGAVMNGNMGLYIRSDSNISYSLSVSGNEIGKVITWNSQTYENGFAFLRIGENVVLNNLTIRPMLAESDVELEYEAYGAMPSPEYPSEIETVNTQANIIICNKNELNFEEKTTSWAGSTVTVAGNKIKIIGSESGVSGLSYSSNRKKVDLRKGTTITYSSKYISGLLTKGNTYYNLYGVNKDGKATNLINLNRQGVADYKTYKQATYTLEEDIKEIYISGSSYTIEGLTEELVYEFQLEIGDTATEIIEHTEQTKTVDIQQEMLTEDDTFIKEDDGWKEVHNWAKIESYNGESITTDYISSTGELETGATVYYKLENPLKLVCTEKQNKQLDDLLNTSTYKNVTHIYSTDKVSPIIKIVYKKDLDTILNNQKNDYDTRLSNIEKLLTTTTTSALLLDNLQTDLEKEVL